MYVKNLIKHSRLFTQRWWINRFKEYHHLLNFDGVIIDLNEPINFGDGERDNGCNRM